MRILGGNKKFNDDKLSSCITIITSTYNAKDYLQWTIDSIRAQGSSLPQWIIVDGNSTDGTLELIRQNEDIIDIWVSESDKGIYDAWNKALPFVKGSWVLFLGAGDELASHTTIDRLNQVLEKQNDAELVYGNVALITEKTRIVNEVKASPWSQIKGKWVFFRPELPDHAGILHSTSFLKRIGGFDSHYKIAGDTHVVLQSILVKEPIYCNIEICRVILGGVSRTVKNHVRMAKEVLSIDYRLGIRPPLLHFLVTAIKLLLKTTIVRLFPIKFSLKILDACRKMQGLEKKWTV